MLNAPDLLIDPTGWLWARRRTRLRLARRQAARDAVTLFHQQCWCWGRDIRLPQGNLLLDRGFTRHRRPAEVVPQPTLIVRPGLLGGTRYELAEGGVTLWLWGFGAVIGGGTGAGNPLRLWLRRYERRPLILPATVPPTGLHDPDSVAPHARPPVTDAEHEATLALRVLLCRWCATYERWLADRVGLAWRRRVVAGMEHAHVAPDLMAVAWSRMADALAGAATRRYH